jgi:hypothetical protein
MAQWAGQYSGLSHATKVDDYEYMLEHAIEIFKSCTDAEKSKKAKSVRKLAAKVLNARLKLVKAKRYEVEPVEAKDWKERRVQIDHLEEVEAKLSSEGTAGILREFGATELTESE